MALHRLVDAVIDVPDPDPVASFYDEFGLKRASAATLVATEGSQIRLRRGAHRRVDSLTVATDDRDDVARVAAAARQCGLMADEQATQVAVTDPSTSIRVTVAVSPRTVDVPAPRQATNGPGRVERPDRRAAGIERSGRVRPRRLSHLVVGTPDEPAARRFFTDVIGFKVSDEIAGLATFLRCSTDHHNLLVQSAPVTFLHHIAWLVDDLDEVGRGAAAMLAADPARHVWGPGRHWLGSNFFWYLRDPSGGFAEYTSDFDVIVDDEGWRPEVVADWRALYAWGPPPPPSFLAPDDLAALMAGSK